MPTRKEDAEYSEATIKQMTTDGKTLLGRL